MNDDDYYNNKDFKKMKDFMKEIDEALSKRGHPGYWSANPHINDEYFRKQVSPKLIKAVDKVLHEATYPPDKKPGMSAVNLEEMMMFLVTVAFTRYCSPFPKYLRLDLFKSMINDYITHLQIFLKI